MGSPDPQSLRGSAATTVPQVTAVGETSDLNPASVYLASLSKRVRRWRERTLNEITDLLYPGQFTAPVQPRVAERVDTPEGRQDFRHALARYAFFKQIYDHRCIYVPWGALRVAHTRALCKQMLRKHTYPVARQNLAVLREVLAAAHALGEITLADYRCAIEPMHLPPRAPGKPPLRPPERDEVYRLIDRCCDDPSPAGPRDAAILALIAATGLRQEQIIQMDVTDVGGDPDGEEGQIQVLEDGNLRLVPLKHIAFALVARWVQIRGGEPGPLFCPVRKDGLIITAWRNTRTGRITPARLTHTAVHNMICRRLREVGLEDVRPYKLRKTLVG